MEIQWAEVGGVLERCVKPCGGGEEHITIWSAKKPLNPGIPLPKVFHFKQLMGALGSRNADAWGINITAMCFTSCFLL